MTFTDELWSASSDIREAIAAHPFVTGLGDGTLPGDSFAYYMAQDALYLGEYSRVLATCASQARDADEVRFWSSSSGTAITVERELHAQFVADFGSAERSPTCTAYTSYLGALGGAGSYGRLVAGVLPCFWIYEYVGARLLERAGDLTGHPYEPWIATYSDPEFAESARTARGILDRAASAVAKEERRRMHQTFLTCSRYEYMFWDAAWRQERWPV